MLSLPNEILAQIIKYLDMQQDIRSVCCVNRRSHWLFTCYLYQFNVLFRNGNGIFWAAKHGDDATARRFLELGVPVDTTFLRLTSSPPRPVSWAVASETHGMTALHMASLKGYRSLVQLFLSKGANPEARFRNEWTPLYLALMSKEEKVARIISWHIPDRMAHLIYSRRHLSPLHLASHLGLATSVRFFLTKDINVNTMDSQQNTPLHHALASSPYDLGYDPEDYTHSYEFRTPSCDRVLETVTVLIEAGADVGREGFASQTPKMLASKHEDGRVRRLFGFIPQAAVPTRPKPNPVHIGRSWMSSNQQFSEEQELRSRRPFHCGYQMQIFQAPELHEREEVIRNCVPGKHPSSLKGVEATGLDFPRLGRMSNSASLNAGSSTWCRSKTRTVIANLVKVESEDSSSISSAQHYEHAESFPQLIHNTQEDRLRFGAKNVWKHFEKLAYLERPRQSPETRSTSLPNRRKERQEAKVDGSH